MKESEFIELLNLYLDHELSAADAARLEAEVQNNPARRKVYQQYCRMQKACKLLTADFQTDTAETAAAGERKIIAFNPAVAEAIAAQRRRTSALLTFGGLAAAACLAVILVNRGQQPGATTPRSESNVAQLAPVTPPAPKAELVRVASESTGPRMLGGPKQPKLVSDQLSLASSTQDVVMANAVSEANEQLKWISSLQITPLQQHAPTEMPRFDIHPTTLRPEARALGSNRAPAEASVEMTAFRFVK
jgi:anti-sigma factor RsiW